MSNASLSTRHGMTRAQYAKPTAAFLELQPEERLMSCDKAAPDELCQDPGGGYNNAS